MWDIPFLYEIENNVNYKVQQNVSNYLYSINFPNKIILVLKKCLAFNHTKGKWS